MGGQPKALNWNVAQILLQPLLLRLADYAISELVLGESTREREDCWGHEEEEQWLVSRLLFPYSDIYLTCKHRMEFTPIQIF